MKSKEQDVAQSSISPVLFMSVEGTPMSFYLRPGPVKVKLQPLITAGGGTVCNVQKPGAILLMDPTEEGSVNETTAHWYVSTNYINDCIEHNKQLNLEDYKLDSSGARKYSTRVRNSNKPSYNALLGGRQHYTPEEDAAIVSCVSKYKKGIRGNLIWKKMEKEGVTCHSWQSMKYRYLFRLAKKDVDEPTVENEPEVQEGENQVDKNPDTKSDESPTAEDASAPHRCDTESESRQEKPAENVQPETEEGEQAAENHLENTDGPDLATSPQPESPALYSAEDCHPVPAGGTDTDETQAELPTPDQIPPTDSPQPQPQTVPPAEVSTLEAPQVKHKSPLRTRSARRQLLPNGLSTPDGGCGQSASSTQPPAASPKPSRKTKSSVQSPQRSATAAEEPPSKKARGDDVTAMAQVHQAADPSATHSDSVAASTPQGGGKKKEKMKLGILELAAREFESESDDDDPAEESSLVMETEKSTKAAPGCSTSDPSTSSQVGCERRAGLQENLQENGQNNEAEENVQETQTTQHRGGIQAATSTAVPAASKAHLFIFDRESQDVESQSIFADRPAALARRPETTTADSAHSLSQIQLEEDKRRIRKLMEETKQDLVTVTKALLKTSGDFSEAHDLLVDLLPPSGTLWQCSDDDNLSSGDPAARLQLQEKYGEELLAKRVVFLELEQ